MPFEPARVGDGIDEVVGERRPAFERRRSLVRGKPREGPGRRAAAERSRVRCETVVLVRGQSDVLTLGATFDPRPVEDFLMACNLRHCDRLIERRERVLLKAGGGSGVPEADHETGIARTLPPKLHEERLALVHVSRLEQVPSEHLARHPPIAAVRRDRLPLQSDRRTEILRVGRAARQLVVAVA